MTIMRGRSARDPAGLCGTMLLGTLLGTIWLTAPAAAAVLRVEMIDGVRHVHNDAVPVRGERTLRLEEIWRIEVMEAEELIGVVSDVISGPDGTVWMSDTQLGRVLVYSAEGTLLRTLCHEGEGPGELVSPRALTWTPGGDLGVIDRRMGEITRVDTLGVPLPSLRLQDTTGQPLASGYLQMVGCRGEVLALCGTFFRHDDAGSRNIRFFSLFDAQGRETRRLMEAPSGFDFQARSFDEAADYFVDHGQWTIDALGRIVYAPDRDRYRLEMRDATGALVQVIERDYRPRRRDEADKQHVRDSVSMSINGESVTLHCDLEDYDKCIAFVMATADGRLWVLSEEGLRDRADDVAGTFDIFDDEGTFQETIRVECPLVPEEDSILMLDDGRWVLLCNIASAQRAMYAGLSDVAAEAADDERPLEIICLKPEED